MSKFKWRNQFVHLEYQSDFHERIRQIFINESPFKNFKCYQELPAKALIENYPFNHEFDWYIEELNTIIELHGRQHYNYTNFGTSFEQAKTSWLKGKERDNIKKTKAIEAGYTYIEIPYNMKVNGKTILDLIGAANEH